LESPGGKCVFERLQSLCKKEVAEVLLCAKVAMEERLQKVLDAPFAAPDGGGFGDGAGAGGAAWEAEMLRLEAFLDEQEPIGLLDWALANQDEGGWEEGGVSEGASLVVKAGNAEDT